eukprot:1158070-Pelagomonas_calceolata.AAC.7
MHVLTNTFANPVCCSPAAAVVAVCQESERTTSGAAACMPYQALATLLEMKAAACMPYQALATLLDMKAA